MTPTQREAMEAALDAMASVIIDYQTGKSEVKAYSIAHAGLRAALTEPTPVQEPVAHLWQHGETGRTRIVMPDAITDCDASWQLIGPLVLAAQPSKEQP